MQLCIVFSISNMFFKILRLGKNTLETNKFGDNASLMRSKRKADQSPLKNERIKRSALGNLTNATVPHKENDSILKKSMTNASNVLPYIKKEEPKKNALKTVNGVCMMMIVYSKKKVLYLLIVIFINLAFKTD